MKKNSIKKIILGAIGVVAAGHIGYATLLMANTTMYGVPAIQISPEEEAARRMFNSQFTVYEGTETTATQVKALISKINTSNGEQTSTKEKYVQYIGPESKSIRSQKKYTVKLKYNNEGYVCEVIVTENASEDSNATQNSYVNEINNNTESTNEDVIKPIQR